jgi:hypothetical protein
MGTCRHVWPHVAVFDSFRTGFLGHVDTVYDDSTHVTAVNLQCLVASAALASMRPPPLLTFACKAALPLCSNAAPWNMS